LTDDQSPVLADIAADESSPKSLYRTPPFLVAAVGASAGGLDAFSRLLRRLPADAPLALVLAQHLARDQQSMLPEILARRTELKVNEARDQMRLEVGHVYIIPSGAHMTVEDGHLRIKPRPVGSSGVQIDLLFRSLAEYYGEKAVGVVLSGGSGDGAAGLREIKAVGGITIAQSPEDAQIDGMPRAAIALGVADLVLPMDEIADELLRLAARPLFHSSGSDESGDSVQADTYSSIFRMLRRTTGVDFSHYKRPTIERRIARRMTLRHAATLESYLEILQKDSNEVHHLQEDVLIHVTSFFREPESFDALKQTTFPALLRQRADGPIRVWVPGCSTGEEVYSLAIALFESLEEEAELVPIQFFGTDVSKVSIERARAGFYSESAVADVSAERLGRFFAKIDAGYQIGKAIRERCVFARQDITRDPPFSRLDLIVCRNTLIYLGQPIQRRIITMMHYALKPNGFLMLGRAETTGTGADLFSTFDKRAKIYRKKPSAIPPEFDFRAAPFEPSVLQASQELAARSTARVSRPWDTQTEANRLLLDRYAPPGILVDASFRIISARGQTAPFLELPSGEASLDALKMIKQGLLAALRGALQEASQSRSVVRKEGLRTLEEHDEHRVHIEVLPVGGPDSPHFFVSFERELSTQRLTPVTAPSEADDGGAFDESLAQLRRELAATRNQLHANIHDLAAANEELQSANEEILSSNEELQSTNEELDTAKEELQSTNEELSTLNDELHGRNEELSLVNSDLANLLASVQIPIVMVARDLTVRRFTPAAQRVLNLIPSDVGRPIGHIKPNIRIADLEKPIAEVVETMVAFEQEVEDEAGRAYLLRIRPYKSIENRVDGAVLALFDISATKDALSLAKRTGEAVIATVTESIILLDSQLKVTRVNSAFCGTFALTPEQTENRYLHQVGDGAWDIPELRKMLEEVLPERKSFENFALRREFPKVGRKHLLLDARRVEAGKSGAGVILLVIRELPNGAA